MKEPINISRIDHTEYIVTVGDMDFCFTSSKQAIDFANVSREHCITPTWDGGPTMVKIKLMPVMAPEDPEPESIEEIEEDCEA